MASSRPGIGMLKNKIATRVEKVSLLFLACLSMAKNNDKLLFNRKFLLTVRKDDVDQ
jgi:hypothetical protein